jgi:hypothetical protein
MVCYVEEDQEEEGQDAPLEGESRQTPQHGSLIHPYAHAPFGAAHF